MTGIRFVAVGLKLVAFWLVLLAIQSVSVVFAVQNNASFETASHWWAALPLAIFLSFAMILWLFPRTIAAKLYGPEKPEDTFQLSEETLLRVGCCLLGFWILSTALPSVARLILLAYFNARIGGSSIPEDSKLHAAYILVQVVVGLVLVFRNRDLYRLSFGRE